MGAAQFLRVQMVETDASARNSSVSGFHQRRAELAVIGAEQAPLQFQTFRRRVGQSSYLMKGGERSGLAGADHQLAKIVQQAAQIGFLGIRIMSDAGKLAGDAGAEQGMPPEIFSTDAGMPGRWEQD